MRDKSTLKKLEMENKKIVLLKIREHKDILFGVFSDTLTKQLKSDKWKEVYDVARSINIVSASKDWTYIRDTFWQNCRKYTFIKIENSKKAGAKKCQLTECDKIVLDIVGRESKVVGDINLEEPKEEHESPSELLENLSSMSPTLVSVAADPCLTTPVAKSIQAQIKKGKKRPVGQLKQLDLKKKKLMVQRIELLNHKTILEIAMLEKQLGIPSSNYTHNILEQMNNGYVDETRDDTLQTSVVKEETEETLENNY